MQLALFIGLLLLITRPLGLYLCEVLDINGRTFLDPVVKPFERLTYRILAIDVREGTGLDSVYDCGADIQHGDDAVYLWNPAIAEFLALEPAKSTGCR